MNRHGLRLTPSNSPFMKTSSPRSPTKSRSEEPGLRLKKVIGTTTASSSAFDCLPSARQFAYTAGAAAVVCTVDDDLQVTQRFFRARPPVGAGVSAAAVVVPGVASPTPTEARSRVLGLGREYGMPGSPLGSSTRDWSDSPTGKSATAKDRVKAATSVALSPNGKWVAVGETGYKPRILLFANKQESSEVPVCALAEHTFGVHALAFSPDSRYLASLGTVNDGFLYIWSIDDRTGAATLHSSNKCTVMVNAMVWVGQSLVTVGLRFVKCWRPDGDNAADRRAAEALSNTGTPRQKAGDFGNSILSPRHRFLPGKNSLLGDLIDANFTTALPLTDDKAIVCTDTGDVCVLSDCHGAQTLTLTAHVDFRITAARIEGTRYLVVRGPEDSAKNFNLDKLGSPLSPSARRRQTITPAKTIGSSVLRVVDTAAIGNLVVELDSKRAIRLVRPSSEQNGMEQISQQLPAHNEAVLGVQQFSGLDVPAAAFLTYSTDGTIGIWSHDGVNLAILGAPIQASSEPYDVANELKAVAASCQGKILITGDRFGTLTVLETATGSALTQVRAHSAEIAEIVAFKRAGVDLVATAGRDRMVQLFHLKDGQLDLLQTMDEHAAAVTGLLVAHSSNSLLSCSADRTIVVREAVQRNDDPASVVYVMRRTMMLKSSPTSMCLADHGDQILVATADRNIAFHNFATGQVGFSFKCSDSDAGEATAMSRILYTPSLNGNPTIVGVSSSDKSVRLYSDYGSLIARDWGHTEGITDVALLLPHEQDEGGSSQLITVAVDSTIFMWDTTAQSNRSSLQQVETNGSTDSLVANKLSTPIGPPLRKVLSFTELSRSKRQRSTDGNGQDSPPGTGTPSHPPPSPQRLRKKTSRMSISQAPRLEPAFRTSFADSIGNRRQSLRKRSPSPPSPRNTAKGDRRKPSLGMSLRSKSSENVLTVAAMNGSNYGFGSLNSSTESLCRTLRAYRKKLAASTGPDSITPENLRELEKELKLTARVLGEKSNGKTIDEATMAKLLDQTSDKIVERLDDRIKERVESEVRKSLENSPSALGGGRSRLSVAIESELEAVSGALQDVALGEE